MFDDRVQVDTAGTGVVREGGGGLAPAVTLRPRVSTRTGWVIMTGHPPVAVQLAGQVRSATGATYAPRMLAISPRTRPADDIAPAAAPEPLVEIDPKVRHVILIDHLLNLVRGEGPLPSCQAMAQDLGEGWDPTKVSHSLTTLGRSGRIKIWWGSAVGLRGKHIIRIPGEARELRSKGVPPAYVLS